MKKLMSFVLAVLMVSVLITPTSAAAAAPGDTITPYWSYISDITVEVCFSGNAGSATVDVSRIFGITTALEGTLTVYENVDGQWTYVDSVSGSSTRSLGLELYFNAVNGASYMAIADIIAYSGEEVETASATDTETCPSTGN